MTSNPMNTTTQNTTHRRVTGTRRLTALSAVGLMALTGVAAADLKGIDGDVLIHRVGQQQFVGEMRPTIGGRDRDGCCDSSGQHGGGHGGFGRGSGRGRCRRGRCTTAAAIPPG